MRPNDKTVGLKDIKTWVTFNFLLLNSDQTKLIALSHENLTNMMSNHMHTLDGVTLALTLTEILKLFLTRLCPSLLIFNTYSG